MRNAQRVLALGAMTLTAGAVFGLTATAASAATTQAEKTTVAQPGADKPGPHGGPSGGQQGGPHGGPSGGSQGGPHGGPSGGPHGGPQGGPRGGRPGDHDRSWIAGWYQNKKTCQFFAWTGAHSGRFDYGVCVPAFGKKGWILVAHERDGRRHHHR
ncbi:hypothetical protein AB0M46_33090 [Dactylosporangium sp. NPDC051485]|uniref:hypothetical protein n=1 Tax=Dactylosporangium sp. NPDC051485 TaxID=3154846 RepID=UPI003412C87A